MIDAIVGMLSQGIHPKEVAKAVVHAINNLKPKLRHTEGKDAEELIEASKNLSEEDFYRTIAQHVSTGQGSAIIITQNNERGVS